MADPGPRSGADGTRRNGRVAKEVGQDVSFKVLMIGDSSVGKTATLGRFTEDNFPHSFISTVGRLGEGRGEFAMCCDRSSECKRCGSHVLHAAHCGASMSAV